MSYFEKRNVLVTGGSGFVGTNLVRRLAELGANVTVNLHKRQPGITKPNVTYVQGDLTELPACRNCVQGIDFVFMCAAVTSGAGIIEKSPLVHLTPNVVMNTRMLDAAYQAGVKKFLFISSSIVYPVSDSAMKEEDVTNEFFDKYHIAGWMKRFTEIVCEMYSLKVPEPMRTIVVRPGNLYGPHDDFEWESSHVLPALIRRVVERHEPIQVWGDGSDIKDFIYIDDFIDGLLLAMEKLDNAGPLNIASGKSVSLRQVLETILKLDDYQDARIEYDVSKPVMIPERLIDVTKARDLLGFEAGTALKEGLRRTITWYRENQR